MVKKTKKCHAWKCIISGVFYRSEFCHLRRKPALLFSKWLFKQAQKGFRPISASQNFLGIFWDFLGNSLRTVWIFFGNSLGILLEFYWNFLEIIVIFFGMYGWGDSHLGFFWEMFENSLEFPWEFYRNSFKILRES